MSDSLIDSVETKLKLVPELRFPEFEKDGEWELKLFSKFIKLDRGSSPRPIQEYLTQDESGVNWIKIGDTKNAINSTIYQVEERITSKGAQKSRRVEKGELILANSMSFGKTYELAIEGCIYDGWFVLRKYEKHFIKQFLLQMLNSNYMQNQYKRLSAGGIVQNISSDIVYNSQLFHTSISEQQKIASCLSSLDELITANREKLEALQAHKKGLMQNLFPQEGQTVPNYRFSEFENDGEWEEVELGKIAKFSKGKGISKSDISLNGALPCIRYGELYTHYRETILEIKSSTNLDPKDLVLSEANDVIIPSSGETPIDIATASCVLKSGVALGGDLNIIKSELNGIFLSYYLNNVKKQEIAQMAQGISVVHLYSNQLKALKINIPSDGEQLKITKCLSDLDELITIQVEKIEQLQNHKKGLMQGLFPKIED
tara:strand:+ start:367 stop:1656 length:1290 start_codon:yes stop_codon:yes gene_type:complete